MNTELMWAYAVGTFIGGLASAVVAAFFWIGFIVARGWLYRRSRERSNKRTRELRKNDPRAVKRVDRTKSCATCVAYESGNGTHAPQCRTSPPFEEVRRNDWCIGWEPADGEYTVPEELDAAGQTSVEKSPARRY